MEIATPNLLVIGEGKSLEVRKYMTDLGIQKPLLIIDPNVIKTDIGDRIGQSIRHVGGVIFDSFTTNPTTFQVDETSLLFTDFQPDSVIAVGGGSAIDLAKATLLVGLNGGKITDYLNGSKKVSDKSIPFIAMPTTCGTGSEASPFAVITDPEMKKKRGIESKTFLPKLVVLDPLLVSTLSKTYMTATGLDALAHIVESYVSTKATNLTQSSARGLLYDIRPAIENTLEDNVDLQAIGILLNAAFSSRLLYPRTGLTIAHALSHPIGANFNIHHGVAVAGLFHESMLFNAPASIDKLDEVSKIMNFKDFSDCDTWVLSLLGSSGITKELSRAVSGNLSLINQMAKDAMESSNIPSNPRSVTSDDLVLVIEKSMKTWNV